MSSICVKFAVGMLFMMNRKRLSFTIDSCCINALIFNIKHRNITSKCKFYSWTGERPQGCSVEPNCAMNVALCTPKLCFLLYKYGSCSVSEKFQVFQLEKSGIELSENQYKLLFFNKQLCWVTMMH